MNGRNVRTPSRKFPDAVKFGKTDLSRSGEHAPVPLVRTESMPSMPALANGKSEREPQEKKKMPSVKSVLHPALGTSCSSDIVNIALRFFAERANILTPVSYKIIEKIDERFAKENVSPYAIEAKKS